MRRSIPAWAGETASPAYSTPAPGVDPRVGGGDRGQRHRDCDRVGSIPAWAGETTDRRHSASARAVDPRVGGGDGAETGEARGRSWSIPAWAGETTLIAAWSPAPRVDPRVGGGDCRYSLSRQGRVGRSPRGRGRPVRPAGGEGCRRSIPAWAGETRAPAITTGAQQVDPRVGGGDVPDAAPSRMPNGRSPRGRGRPCFASRASERAGSIPAWAGETPAPTRPPTGSAVDPRVGGGDTLSFTSLGWGDGRSPRGRGRQDGIPGQVGLTWSIPAWAGETR